MISGSQSARPARDQRPRSTGDVAIAELLRACLFLVVGLVAGCSHCGNRGRPGPIEKSSDGIVSYWSSHLPDADSEKIVPGDHGLIDHPETLAEIKRILKL